MNMRKLIESHAGSGQMAARRRRTTICAPQSEHARRLLELLVDAEESVYGLANFAIGDGDSLAVTVVPHLQGNLPEAEEAARARATS